MLGDKLGEERGRITGTRVLPAEASGPKVEVSFQTSGKLLDMDMTDMGTYCSSLTPAGTLFGEGQGVVMTTDGDVATWSGEGVGRFTGHGSAVNWRGAIYYQTAAPRLARFNSVAAVFEFDVDEDGNVHGQDWEWK